jgi:hypothetical protein
VVLVRQMPATAREAQLALLCKIGMLRYPLETAARLDHD